MYVDQQKEEMYLSFSVLQMLCAFVLCGFLLFTDQTKIITLVISMVSFCLLLIAPMMGVFLRLQNPLQKFTFFTTVILLMQIGTCFSMAYSWCSLYQTDVQNYNHSMEVIQASSYYTYQCSDVQCSGECPQNSAFNSTLNDCAREQVSNLPLGFNQPCDGGEYHCNSRWVNCTDHFKLLFNQSCNTVETNFNASYSNCDSSSPDNCLCDGYYSPQNQVDVVNQFPELSVFPYNEPTGCVEVFDTVPHRFCAFTVGLCSRANLTVVFFDSNQGIDVLTGMFQKHCGFNDASCQNYSSQVPLNPVYYVSSSSFSYEPLNFDSEKFQCLCWTVPSGLIFIIVSCCYLVFFNPFAFCKRKYEQL